MNRRIAVAIGLKENGHTLLANSFETCKSIVVFELSRIGNVVSKETYPNPQLQSKETTTDIVSFLNQLCVDRIITGELDDEVKEKLDALDIKSISLPGNDLENVVQQYIKKNYIYKEKSITEFA